MKDVTPQELAALLRQTRRALALTGAGISVDSGIPDFRSKDGLWSRFDPLEYATIRAFRKNPAKVWVMLKEMDRLLLKARPNPAHYALAQLERRGHLFGVITQNVDNLHQAAGSRQVVEYHGNAHRFVCLSCGGKWAREDLDLKETPLYCLCGGLIKPDVVFFGEPIPEEAMAQAEAWTRDCEMLLLIGTSGEVAPANLLPEMAKAQGALIVESNLTHTRLTPFLTDFFLPGPAGVVWPEVITALDQTSTST
uniref:protein acetyllysine N-acetyltransferase n=1 Tax=Desulfobacca acetoxidans TaxID=60893 RepID=A0A7C5ES21_9BACT